MARQHRYLGKVTPDKDGGFVGEVVDKNGRPAGLSSRTPTAAEAADDAVHFADRLNEADGQR